MSNLPDSQQLDPRTLGEGRELLDGGEDFLCVEPWSWVAMLYRHPDDGWVCGLSKAAGEVSQFDGPEPIRCRSGGELFAYLLKVWEQYSEGKMTTSEWERLSRRIQATDYILGKEFAIRLAKHIRSSGGRHSDRDTTIGAKRGRKASKRTGYDSIEELEEMLTDVEVWDSATKKALTFLHAGARREAVETRRGNGAMGVYQELEQRLFGDPLQLMSEHDEQGQGFDASLMDGMSVDIFGIAGFTWTDALHDKVWGQYNWQSVLDKCDEAFCVELGEQDDMPGMSDIFYWVCIEDPHEFARQMREFIVSVKG